MGNYAQYYYSQQSTRFVPSGVRVKSGRAVVYSDLKVHRSYTLETSVHGYRKPGGTIQAFEERDLFDIGESLCKAIL